MQWDKRSEVEGDLDQALIRELQMLLAEQTGVAPEEVSQELILQHRDLFLEEYRKQQADRCVHLLFQQRAGEDPGRTAVVEGGRRISRGRLNSSANQLARCLQERGVGPETVVAVCLPLSLRLLEVLLGIMKAGGAYALIDPSEAPGRRDHLLKKFRPALLLTCRSMAGALCSPGGRTLLLEHLQGESAEQPEGDLRPLSSPENLACLWCGYEEALAVEHREVCGLLEGLQEDLKLSSHDSLLLHSFPGREPASWEIFWPLAFGGGLILEGIDGPDAEQATLAHFTPSQLGALLEEAASEWLASMRLVFTSGETLQQRTVSRFYRRGGQRLLLLYTPPGTAGRTSWLDCGADRDWEVMPVGGNRSFLILDQSLQPLPVGLAGEICLAAEELPRGWRDAPRATAQSFSMHPFTSRQGARLVRTGDRGSRLEDGSIELQGCLGQRCWLGGYRLDLGKLEAELRLQEGIDDAALLLRETQRGPRLAAYLVPSAPWRPKKLRACLQQLLPDGLPPCALLPLNRLPMMASGLLDETALSRLEVIDAELAERWEEVLRSESAVEEAVVLIDEQPQAPPPFHLSDLLTDWRPLQAAAQAGEGEADGQSEGGSAGKQEKTLQNPSLSHGPPLPDGIPATLAQALQRAAGQGKEQGVTYIQPDGTESHQSYADLLDEARRVLGGLRRLGLEPQDKVIFQLEDLQDFVTVFWGCQLGGFVPVPLSIAPSYQEGDAAVRKLHNTWRMLERPLTVASPALLPALDSLQSLLGLDGWRVESAASLRSSPPDRRIHECDPQDAALLLFTSGSTGRPKGVVQTQRALLSRSAATAQMNGFTPQDVSLNWMPLDHVGGVVMFHLRDVLVGCRQIQAPTALVLEQPLRWMSWIDRYRATITWAPNFAFGLANQQSAQIADRPWDLSCMRFVLNGGEAIVPRTARRFLKLLIPKGLPATAMKPAWGMSETCSGVTYSHRFGLESTSDDDPFAEVGGPIPGFSQRIVDEQDQVLEEGRVGRLQVKGSMVTCGYYQDPDLNQQAFTQDGWFITGDLGRLSQGRLTITGREKDVIIINGINYYSHEIESLAEEVEGVEVSCTAAFAVRPPGSQTDRMAVLFCSPQTDWEGRLEVAGRIRQRIADGAGLKADYVVPVQKKDIPKTAIGKIQRPRLRRRFEEGGFSDLLKRIDLAASNSNTLPSWFYRVQWRPKRLTRDIPWAPQGDWLIFSDSRGLAKELIRRLRRSGQRCTEVEAGSEFERPGKGRFRLGPGCAEHYRRLFEALSAEGRQVGAVVHLWSYGQPKGAWLEMESGSLLMLLQELARLQDPDSGAAVRLLAVSSHSQSLNGGQEVLCERAALAALIRTAAQEIPWLRAMHLDLAPQDSKLNASRVLREAAAPQGDREACWRTGRRLVPRLQRIDPRQEPRHSLPFQKGGLYLLSGGLGGIGTHLAGYLLGEWDARLLLVGRSRLAQEDAGLQDLQSMGGQVIYQATDVSDAPALAEAVERAESLFSRKLAGVLHLAGVLRECPLLEETPQGLQQALAPKLEGAQALRLLLDERPDAFFIGFSSVNSFFGGAGVGAHAAANRSLEAFCQQLCVGGKRRTQCLSWSMWDEVGLSRGYAFKQASQAQGFSALTAKQGLNSLLAALQLKAGHLLVGLDSTNRNIRRQADSEPLRQEGLNAFYTLRRGCESAPGLQELSASDGLGTPGRCSLSHLEEMPRASDGTIDRARLIEKMAGRRVTAAERVAPRNELERKLAQIWQQVLGLDQVGIHDNYFQLGGDSILSIQMIARMAEAGLRLTPQHIFQNPTVAGLASQVQQSAAVQAQQEAVEGEVALTPVQRWFFEQGLPAPHHFNMSVLLEVRQPMRPDLLSQAADQLVRRHDALRLRYRRQQRGWRQFNALVEENPVFAWIDLSRLEEGRQREALEASSFSLQTSFNLEKGPLLRMAGFGRGQGRSNRLLILIHHLVVDGVSWRILLEDLQAAYQMLEKGRPIRLPSKTTSFQQWAKRIEEYAPSEALAAQQQFWLDQPVAEPLPTDLAGGANILSSTRTVSLSLDESQTRQLLQEAPQAYRTQVNDLLLTALAQTIVGWSGKGRVLVDLEGHGREDLFEDVDLSRTVGWFTTIFPVWLELDPDCGPGEAIKSVKEQLRRIPQRGLGYGLLRYMRRRERPSARLSQLPQPEISFNYLGQFDQTLPRSGPLAMASESVGPSSHLAAKRPHLLDVSAHVIDGRLEVVWMYSSRLHRDKTVQRLAQDYLSTLKSLAEHCLSSRAGGYTPSDFPLARLTQEELDQLIGEIAESGSRAGEIESIYPLSPMQQGMLFQAISSSRPGVYFEQFHCELHGQLDLEAFRESWQLLAGRHAVLRTFFVRQQSPRPLQVVGRRVEVPLHLHDWRADEPARQQSRLKTFLEDDRRQGFRLSAAPQMRLALIRTDQQTHRLVWSFNHLLLDGWSLPLIFKDVLTFYQALRFDQPVELEPTRPYQEYIAWLQQQDLSQAEACWRRRLRGFRAATPLGEAEENPGAAASGHGEARLQLSDQATQGLIDFARRRQLTLNVLTQGAWALLLSGCSGEEDVVFGATVSGRPPDLPGVESMLGLFINTVPVRVEAKAEAELLPWLQSLQEQQAQMQPYEFTPLPRIHEWSEVPGSRPLFESILVFENFPIDESVSDPIPDLEIRSVRSIEQSNFPLAVMVLMEPRLTLIAYYDSGRFGEAYVLGMLGHFGEILQQMAAQAQQRLGDLPFFREAEERIQQGLSQMQSRNQAERFDFGQS